jgi:Transcriptional regulators
MADISLNENRLALLIWQISNLWQSKVKLKLKHLNIGFNEYLILETLSKLQQKSQSISQQDICKQSSMDRSVVSLRILKLEKKNLITKIQPKDRRSNSLILTSKGNNLIKDIKYIIEDQEKEIFDKLGSEIFNFTNSLKLLLGKKIRIRAKLND